MRLRKALSASFVSLVLYMHAKQGIGNVIGDITTGEESLKMYWKVSYKFVWESVVAQNIKNPWKRSKKGKETTAKTTDNVLKIAHLKLLKNRWEWSERIMKRKACTKQCRSYNRLRMFLN